MEPAPQRSHSPSKLDTDCDDEIGNRPHAARHPEQELSPVIGCAGRRQTFLVHPGPRRTDAELDKPRPRRVPEPIPEHGAEAVLRVVVELAAGSVVRGVVVVRVVERDESGTPLAPAKVITDPCGGSDETQAGESSNGTVLNFELQSGDSVGDSRAPGEGKV